MGQPSELLAFRKRLKNAGYFDIHIKKHDDEWIVSACEPLGGYRVTIQTKGVDHLFRRRLHGGGYVYRPASKPYDENEGLPTSE